MKKYSKPTLEFVELRVEERMADQECKWQGNGWGCSKYTGASKCS